MKSIFQGHLKAIKKMELYDFLKYNIFLESYSTYKGIKAELFKKSIDFYEIFYVLFWNILI